MHEIARFALRKANDEHVLTRSYYLDAKYEVDSVLEFWHLIGDWNYSHPARASNLRREERA